MNTARMEKQSPPSFPRTYHGRALRDGVAFVRVKQPNAWLERGLPSMPSMRTIMPTMPKSGCKTMVLVS